MIGEGQLYTGKGGFEIIDTEGRDGKKVGVFDAARYEGGSERRREVLHSIPARSHGD